jgi:protein-S-isoprenylcysteine O-methyltransferase Ste14
MGVGTQAAEQTAFPAQHRPAITLQGLRHVGANLGLAAMFFAAAVPYKGVSHLSAPADLIWSVGMLLMGIFCIMRPKPSAVMLDWRAMVSGAGAMVLPALMRRSTAGAAGMLYPAAVMFEFLGVAISQIARVYMGRTFAVLPANRGIVSSGPFRFVRHPVYLGWLLLSCGYALVYPTLWNVIVFALCLALTIWRINLEEELLSADSEYRAYLARARWRMIPSIY